MNKPPIRCAHEAPAGCLAERRKKVEFSQFLGCSILKTFYLQFQYYRSNVMSRNYLFFTVLCVWFLTDNHKSSITSPCLNQSQPHSFSYWISFNGSKKNTAKHQTSAFLKQKNWLRCSASLSPFFICSLVQFLTSFFVFLPETWTMCKQMLHYTPVWLLSYDLRDLWDRKTWWSHSKRKKTQS